MNTKAAALIEHSDAETTQLLNEKEQKNGIFVVVVVFVNVEE